MRWEWGKLQKFVWQGKDTDPTIYRRTLNVFMAYMHYLLQKTLSTIEKCNLSILLGSVQINVAEH